MNQVSTNFKTGMGGKKKPALWWEKLHLEEVKKQCCIVCGKAGPSEAHHCFCDRITKYVGKAGHLDTIPLCDEHHQAKFQYGGFPIHGKGTFGGKKTWVAEYGPDWGYLTDTKLILYGDALITDEEIEQYWLECR